MYFFGAEMLLRGNICIFLLLVLFIGPAPFQRFMNANALSHADYVGHVGSEQGSYSALFQTSSVVLQSEHPSEELHSHPSPTAACRVEEGGVRRRGHRVFLYQGQAMSGQFDLLGTVL